MESLFDRATVVDLAECTLPSGRRVTLRRLTVRFGRASPDCLPTGSLPASYATKPLVTSHGATMFGELAVLGWLEVDDRTGA